jgi:ubiquinone/menaquinone biosynthesis C-methylase UbiE
LDAAVVAGFGQEWKKFHHLDAAEVEERRIFDTYFDEFPWDALPPNAEGFDLGCGSGRWAYFVAPRVGLLHCVDPSTEALEVARTKLGSFGNCKFHVASVDAIPLAESLMDFGYAIGVLHHVPDTQSGIAECVRRLKPGAPFLLYLYYAFDNRPAWFRLLWRVSNLVRVIVSRMPFWLRSFLSETAAACIYWPLARTARLAQRLGFRVESFPLSAYRDRSFYQMRNDALDRFGTRIEKRFSKKQIQEMMEASGLDRISFKDFPCWCALGYKRLD